MISFFKPKPTLLALIPEGFVDIHSHILPGLDDGAKTMAQSKELIQDAVDRVSEFIATPHTMTSVWDNTTEGIQAVRHSLDQEYGTEAYLRCASEYLLDTSFLDRLQKDDLLCLKDKMVLVELSYLQPPMNLFEFYLNSN